ncbi:MAG TPA: hypothetical protein PKM78_17555 [Anaerolineae bacterium]|nr:hypothetical protein [Anaerolineae bacterium]HNU05951.1 hypothetical protein [Anaerolineae bacterium]
MADERIAVQDHQRLVEQVGVLLAQVGVDGFQAADHQALGVDAQPGVFELAAAFGGFVSHELPDNVGCQSRILQPALALGSLVHQLGDGFPELAD